MRGKRLWIGDTVLCRYFNSVEGRFYGNYFTGMVLSIDVIKNEKMYRVMPYASFMSTSWLHRKEIKRVLESQ